MTTNRIIVFCREKWGTDVIIKEELIEKVKEFLEDKSFIKSSRISKEFHITGSRAAAVLKELGWKLYSTKTWCSPEV